MEKLLTPIFRVSFPQVFSPKAMNQNAEPKYSLTALFNMKEIGTDPEQKKLYKGLVDAVRNCAINEWGSEAKIPKNFKNPFRDGEEKENFDGYGEGIRFIVLTSKTKPGLVDAAVQPIINQEEFYAGCYAHATINAYAWSYMGKNGVSFGLQNIQKLKDGEPFGAGRRDPTMDFDAVSVAEDEVEEEENEDIEESLFG